MHRFCAQKSKKNNIVIENAFTYEGTLMHLKSPSNYSTMCMVYVY